MVSLTDEDCPAALRALKKTVFTPVAEERVKEGAVE